MASSGTGSGRRLCWRSFMPSYEKSQKILFFTIGPLAVPPYSLRMYFGGVALKVHALPRAQAGIVVTERLENVSVHLVRTALARAAVTVAGREYCASEPAVSKRNSWTMSSPGCTVRHTAAEPVHQRNAVQHHVGGAYLHSVRARRSVAFDTGRQVEQIGRSAVRSVAVRGCAGRP